MFCYAQQFPVVNYMVWNKVLAQTVEHNIFVFGKRLRRIDLRTALCSEHSQKAQLGGISPSVNIYSPSLSQTFRSCKLLIVRPIVNLYMQKKENNCLSVVIYPESCEWNVSD